MTDHTQSVVRPKPYQLLGTPRNSSELLTSPPKLLPTPPNSSQTHWITPPNSLDIQAMISFRSCLHSSITEVIDDCW